MKHEGKSREWVAICEQIMEDMAEVLQIIFIFMLCNNLSCSTLSLTLYALYEHALFCSNILLIA